MQTACAEQNRLDAKQRRNLVETDRDGDQNSVRPRTPRPTGLHHGDPVREHKRLVTVVCDQRRRRPCLMEALPQHQWRRRIFVGPSSALKGSSRSSMAGSVGEELAPALPAAASRRKAFALYDS